MGSTPEMDGQLSLFTTDESSGFTVDTGDDPDTPIELFPHYLRESKKNAKS